MGNIWELLYQTLTVSAVAAVLLLVKWLLRDKLSPRWQYGVWAVLALRAVIPAGTARSVAPALALCWRRPRAWRSLAWIRPTPAPLT